MVLDNLGGALKKTIAKIRGVTYIDEKTLNEITRDLQRALIHADVNVKLVFKLTENIKTSFKENKAPPGIAHKDYLVHILYEELTKLVGGKLQPVDTSAHHPFVFMLVGLFGSGKTTTTGKLAKYYQKRGKRVLIISTDTWRPAAARQLQTLAERIGVESFVQPDEKDPKVILENSKPFWDKHDIVIVDTAGRDALSDELIEELQGINEIAQPHFSFLVLSADIGQAAEKQATAFAQNANVKGVIITKMDGTAKGGGALSACAITQAPVRFLGVGEDVSALEEFKPANFISRLLGMGDLESLVERVQEAFTQEDAETMEARLAKGEFTLNDFYQQMQAMKKMGPISKVAEMIPGFGQMQIPKEMLQEQQGKLDQFKTIIDSCAKKERAEPEIIDHSRIARIAAGSGTDETDVRLLLKQHRQAKKMLKMLKGGPKDEKQMKKMMQRMGKGRAGFKF